MIATPKNRKDYIGDGVLVSFAYDFLIFSASDLIVKINGIVSTAFTVSGVGNETGGNVTFAIAPLAGDKILILRQVPLTQTTDIPSGGPFPEKAVEDAYDKLTMEVQQVDERLDRAFILPEESLIKSPVFPDSPSPGLKLFRWNAAAGALELVTATDAGFTTIMLPAMSTGSPIFASAVASFSQVSSVKYAGAYADFAAAVTAIGSVETTLLVTENEVISTAVIVPVTLHIVIQGVGKFTKSGSGSISFAGPVDFPTRQIFSGFFGTDISFDSNISVFLPEWWGAVPDGIADSTVAIQNAIDVVNAKGSGYVKFMSLTAGKSYKAVGLILKTGVTLIGSSFKATPEQISGSKLSLFSAGTLVDTPSSPRQHNMGIINMALEGLGAATPGIGVDLKDVRNSILSGLTWSGFADQALKRGTGTSLTVIDCFAQNCLLNRIRTGKSGVFEIRGGDDYYTNLEISAASTVLSDLNLRVAAIALLGGASSGNHSFNNVIAEISDIGFHIDSTNNKFVNCRSDLNFGHGTEVLGSGNLFTNHHSLANSRETTNLYDGFTVTTGQNNKFVNCVSESRTSDANKHRHGFNDALNQDSNKNNYSSCNSIGHLGKAFNTVNFAGSSVKFDEGPPKSLVASDTTPSVEQYTFFSTNNSVATIISNFDDAVSGQKICVIFQDINTTIDFTGTVLKGNAGVDFVGAINDMLVGRFTGSVWICQIVKSS